MPTECNLELFDFARVEGRAVVAAFDGGRITSDAGALLLGATDRVIGLTRRLAACFTGGRHRAGLRGPDRSRRTAPRPGDGGAGRQTGSSPVRLRTIGRQEHAEPAG